jgi:hypothetical protein
MMDHNETTAEGLATWIERRKHTPAELRQVLRYALHDAEARGEERGERLVAPADPAPEQQDWMDAAADGLAGLAPVHEDAFKGAYDHVFPEPARPLNAHVGRRIPVVQAAPFSIVEESTPGTERPTRWPLVRKVG